MENKAFKYFISYGHSIKYFADAFYEFLLDSGIDSKLIFKDDKGAIQYGSNKGISEVITSGIESCEYFFPIIGSYLTHADYMDSYLRLEINYALSCMEKSLIKIIPIKINNINSIIDKDFYKISDMLSLNIGCEFDDKTTHQGLISLLNELHGELPADTQSLINKFTGKVVGDKFDHHADLVFHNRDRERQDILDDASKGTYHIICGPTQYGKTRLLKEIEEWYKKNQWSVYYVSLDSDVFDIDPDDIYERIIGIKTSKRDFITRIIDEFLKKGKGVVFLFDLSNNGCDVQRQLISHFMSTLTDDRAFKENIKNNFKLIATSRLINGEDGWPIPYNKISRLSEFGYATVRDAVVNYLGRFKIQLQVDELSSQIFLISGGHPRCVKRMLDYYIKHRVLPHNNMRAYSDDRIANIAGANHALISYEFRENPISIFRYIDMEILVGLNVEKANLVYEKLRQHGIYQVDPVGSEDNLDSLNTRNMVLKDGILRRVYVIHLCLANEKMFLQYCDQARDFYFDFIKKKHLGSSRLMRWLIEYWFSKLQKKLFIALGCGELSYKDISLDFEYDICTGVSALLNQCKNEKLNYNPIKKLKEMLRDDWEFQLMLNFEPKIESNCGIYRSDLFSDLIKKIDDCCILYATGDV